MTEFSALSAAAAGMEAQRAALDVDARNVAAAETGAPFDRLVPRFAFAASDEADTVDADTLGNAAAFEDTIPDAWGQTPESFVRFVGTTAERGSGVDAITEMVAVLNAQRAFEADAAVFDAGKRLAERTIDVGRT